MGVTAGDEPIVLQARLLRGLGDPYLSPFRLLSRSLSSCLSLPTLPALHPTPPQYPIPSTYSLLRWDSPKLSSLDKFTYSHVDRAARISRSAQPYGLVNARK